MLSCPPAAAGEARAGSQEVFSLHSPLARIRRQVPRVLRRRIIPVTPFQQNCSLFWSTDSGVGVVVDPGGEVDRILAAVTQESVQVERVLLTHAHLDHASGARALADALNVPVDGPGEDDLFWLEAMPAQSQMFGFPPTEVLQPDRWLSQGDSVTFGDETLEVIHCPGHTPGHMVFFHAEARLAFVGDVLFNGSVGRTDFPRGNAQQLVESIRTRLWPLGDDVTFVPGHGPESTFGFERATNPFVGDALFD